MSDFNGLGTALITPFRDNRIDLDALAVLVERQVSAQVDFLVVLGTTGEASTLSQEEIQAVIAKVLDVNAGRLPVVLGIFGGNNTDAVVQKMESYPLSGIDALLSVTPHYNRPSQQGLLAHYKALNQAATRPIIMYNVPKRTGVNLSATTVQELARTCDNIVGIKEASGDMWQGAQMIRDCPKDFLITSGDDQSALPLLSLGAKGIISVISNAYPEEFASLVRFAMEDDYRQARAQHQLLLDIHPYLYAQSNPAGIKACLSHMGLCTSDVRLPLVPLSRNLSEGLEEAMLTVRQKSA